MISKFNVELKKLSREDVSKPEFMVTWFINKKKLIGRNNFPVQFRKIIIRYKRIGYCITYFLCNILYT